MKNFFFWSVVSILFCSVRPGLNNVFDQLACCQLESLVVVPLLLFFYPSFFWFGFVLVILLVSHRDLYNSQSAHPSIALCSLGVLFFWLFIIFLQRRSFAHLAYCNCI